MQAVMKKNTAQLAAQKCAIGFLPRGETIFNYVGPAPCQWTAGAALRRAERCVGVGMELGSSADRPAPAGPQVA
jgi:hypothetical protein